MTAIARYSDRDHRQQVVALWKDVFGYDQPRNDPALSIDRKLAVDDLLFVALVERKVVGTAMAGYDGHRGWLYSVAVAKDERRRGIGAALVRYAERELARLGCMKINLQVLPANEATAAFYSRLGYVIEPRVSMGKQVDANVPK